MSETIAEKHEDIMNGAVYKCCSTTFLKGKDGVPVDDKGYKITMPEWKAMTLKTPAPKPEYSREFEIIEPWVMAKLMYEGEVLEFSDGTMTKYDDKDGVFRYFKCHLRGIVICWKDKCRVYQEAKKETRYNWLIKRGDEMKVSSRKYKNSYLARNDIFEEWSLLYKIEESAEEFTI